MKKKINVILMSILIFTLASGCTGLFPGTTDPNIIIASGLISADDVLIAPELGGKIVEVVAKEGQIIKEGEVLFKLDPSILQAQVDQSKATVTLATASIDTANSQLASVKLQLEIVTQAARFQDIQIRTTKWEATQSDKFKLPIWYFNRSELIDAAQTEVVNSKQSLDLELTNLASTIQKSSNADVINAEIRLAEAQATFQVAQTTLDQANTSNNTDLKKSAQEQLDKAQADLDAAQKDYDRILTTKSAQDVLEARARTSVSQARYDNAIDRYNQLLTGDNSLQIKAAQATIQQAENGVVQAEANLSQAQAGLKVLETQLSKTIVYAPISGTILSSSLEVGEAVAPGSTIMVIGKLDIVKLTIYVPEDKYGMLKLGQTGKIKVDSFPNNEFEGTITYISNQAEFTPRNVQTIEGRKSTVYAIDIQVPNPETKLKPGMPADVTLTAIQ